MQFIYLVFTRMPGGVTVDDVGLLLCPLSVECYYLPLFVDHCFLQTAATLWATAAGVADRYHYRQPQQWTMTAKGDHWSHGCALLASLCRLSLAAETALRWQAGLWDFVTPDHWVVLLLPRLGWPRLNAYRQLSDFLSSPGHLYNTSGCVLNTNTLWVFLSEIFRLSFSFGVYILIIT